MMDYSSRHQDLNAKLSRARSHRQSALLSTEHTTVPLLSGCRITVQRGPVAIRVQSLGRVRKLLMGLQPSSDRRSNRRRRRSTDAPFSLAGACGARLSQRRVSARLAAGNSDNFLLRLSGRCLLTFLPVVLILSLFRLPYALVVDRLRLLFDSPMPPRQRSVEVAARRGLMCLPVFISNSMDLHGSFSRSSKVLCHKTPFVRLTMPCRPANELPSPLESQPPRRFIVTNIPKHLCKPVSVLGRLCELFISPACGQRLSVWPGPFAMRGTVPTFSSALPRGAKRN